MVLASAIGALLLGLAGVAVANDPILHEFFVIPASERAEMSAGPASNEPGDGAGEELAASLGADPTTAEADLSAPPLTIENDGDELELNEDGTGTTSAGEQASVHNGPSSSDIAARPDRKTTLDATLQFYTVFNPSVVPWKRVVARDHVMPDYGLGVRDTRKRRVKVKNRPVRTEYDRFWGSVLIRFEADALVPLPVVAPKVNILRVQSEPPVSLTFMRDGADNYFVSSDYEGVVRINYLLEAPHSYFGGSVDPNVEVRDLPRDRRPRLPSEVQEAADRAVAHIGVDRGAPFAIQLDTLVAYFRSFKAEEFPEEARSQNVYLDLTLNKLGVCRHRAYAFVITAHAVGIEARYLHNEAHAWVEVLVPRQGWRRIDLGGAAVDFEVHNADSKVVHTPEQRDDLPRPPGFSDSYSFRAGRGDQEADIDGDGESEPIEGLPSETSRPRLGSADEPQGDGTGPGAGGRDGEAETSGSSVGRGGDRALDDEPSRNRPAENLNFPKIAPDDPRRSGKMRVVRDTRLRLVRADRDAYRGESIVVEGNLVTDRDVPLPNQPVVAYLVIKGQEGRPEAFRPVGEGKTDEKGRVIMKAKIPPTLSLGNYGLYLYFKGTPNLRPSNSN